MNGDHSLTALCSLMHLSWKIICKRRSTALSTKNQGPIHLHLVCINLIVCFYRKGCKATWFSVHSYGMKLVSAEIWQNLREFWFWGASAANSISCRRHMKQNPSKLIKELNAEHPAEVICSSSPALHTAGSSACATGPVWLLKHPTVHISETSDYPHFTVPLSQGKNIFHQRGRKRFFPGTPGRISERRWSPGGVSRLWALSYFPVGGSIQTRCQRDLWWLWVLFHTPRRPWHTGYTRSPSPQQEKQAGPQCCCRPAQPESLREFKNFRGMWCTSEILKWNIPSTTHPHHEWLAAGATARTGLPEAQQVLLPNIPNTRHGSFFFFFFF